MGKKVQTKARAGTTDVRLRQSSDRIANKIDHLLVAEDKSGRPARSEQLVQHRRRYLAISILVVGVLGLGVYFSLLRNNPADNPTISVPAHNLSGIVDTERVEDVVRDYGTEYDASYREVQNSNYTEWDQAALDSAYFSLVYADKVGTFSQVYALLSLIDAAEKNGMNIDDNSFGVDKAGRDAIRHRADERAQKVRKEGNSE